MFNATSYKEPFWAKSGDFVKGRDPLGIQNSSIATYSRLLPGMTNLTLRIRYYGFYLWLLKEYTELSVNNKFKNSYILQYTFVRRGELIIAFLMGVNHPEQLSIIGSNYVSNHIDELQTSKLIDIAKGADKNEETEDNEVYWGYNSGALGQYYAGSLIALDLIDVRSSFFIPTERGLELATAFGQNISESSKALFLSIIENGILKHDELEKLDDFSINRNISATQEQEYYLQLLLEDDGENFKTLNGEIPKQRKQTLMMMLQFLKENTSDYKWYELPEVNYYNIVNNEQITFEAKLGWYYYYLNELCHYSLETIFWGILNKIDGKIYSMNQLLQKMTKKIIKNISNDIKITKETQLKDVLSEVKNFEFSVPFLQIDILSSVKEDDSVRGIASGIILLLTTYVDNESRLLTVENYGLNNGLNTKNGNAIQIYNRYITTNLEITFSKFIEKIIGVLLNNHINIAYNKMGNGTKNLLKFIVEDNILVHIETMTPNFTNPRLRTLHNFMVDLQLIDGKDDLTSLGEELLKKLKAA